MLNLNYTSLHYEYQLLKIKIVSCNLIKYYLQRIYVYVNENLNLATTFIVQMQLTAQE